MPTEPLLGLLNREAAKEDAEAMIQVATPLLRELVNYGTQMFNRCQAASTGNENEDLAVLMLYLHIIEMADAISVLVSESCATAAKPLVRSMFETLLYMEYILEKEYVRRSLSWLVEYVHNRLSSYEVVEPSTGAGQEFQAILADDKVASGIIIPAQIQARVPRAIDNLENFLARPDIQPIETEYQLCKKRKRRRPNWYSLFGGPGNLRELALYLKRGGEYQIQYRDWSSISHPQDLSRFISRTEEGIPAFKALRNPEELASIGSTTASLMLNATRLLAAKFLPNEDIAEWYKREVRQRYFSLLGVKV